MIYSLSSRIIRRNRLKLFLTVTLTLFVHACVFSYTVPEQFVKERVETGSNHRRVLV